MNILVFSWRDPKHPLAGGAEQVMHEHMKGWIRAGHNVTLFSSRVVGLPNTQTLDKVKIIRKGIQYLGVQLEGFLYYIKNRKKYDLVIDQFHGLPFFTPLYVKKPILAVVQEVAGKVWLKNEFPFPFNFILGLIGYLSEPFIFIFYKNIQFMTGSNSAKESLVKVGIPAKNITIIPHGVLVVRPKPIPKKEKTKTVIFLGAISRDKGIEDVLLTFASLNKMGNYKFWLVGRASDMYLKSIKNTSEKLGFSKNLTYFGFVSQKEKFRLLAKAHVLINPSLLEGWGLVNIEANSMGTPVVAYKSAGLVDSVKNNISGVITKKNTPEDLAVITDKILNNKKKYKALREGALIWSSRFNWKNSRKLSLALIQKIIIK